VGESLGVGETLGLGGKLEGPGEDEADGLGETEADGEAEPVGDPVGMDGEELSGGPGGASVGNGTTGTSDVAVGSSGGVGAPGDGAVDPDGRSGPVGEAVGRADERPGEGIGVAVGLPLVDGIGDRPGPGLGSVVPERRTAGGPY
jgi:hypothetical protein